MRHHARARVIPLLVAVAAVVVGCSDDDGRATTTTAATASSSAPVVASADWHPPECTIDPPTPVDATPVDGVPADLVLTSFDDTPIRIHWFPAPGLAEGAVAPTVLMGPGWGLAGDTQTEAIGVLGSVNIASLRDAGYNVVTWDPRGFGESGGVATVNDPEREGRDVQRLLDWVAEQPVAQLDAPGDPRVGMVGGSYGGGIQLVTAAIDCRVDAIVPTIAWHSLETSLYKAETVKVGWAGRLADLPTGAVTDPHVANAYRDGADSGVLSEEDIEWFRSRGPGEMVEQIRVPTLIVQGTVDTLFTLDEALTNLAILEGNGVPSAMVWYCGGHGVCLTDPGDTRVVAAATIAWLDRWVRRDESVDTGPRMDLIVQTGDRYTAPAFPDPTSTVVASGSGTLDLEASSTAGPATLPEGASGLVDGIAVAITPASAQEAVEVEIRAEEDALVIGAPQLTLTYTGDAPEGERPTRIFAQLVDPSTGLVLGNQITPISVVLDGNEHTVEVPMEVVAFDAAAGSTLQLQLVASTVAYATPRLGGTVDFGAIDISLPVVEGLSSRPSP